MTMDRNSSHKKEREQKIPKGMMELYDQYSYNSGNAQSNQSYIEKDFLVEKLTPIVNREVNAKNPIYQIHKWWARRLASVFGMLLVTSFAHENKKRRDIWAGYVKGTSLKGKIILDPMMGGGTSIVETLRLGGKAIGVDINPVAWFVTKKEIEPLDLSLTENAFRALEKEVGREIREFYQTKCLKGHSAEIMYALWHKQIECSRCHSIVAILQNYIISERNEKLSILCPSCGVIFKKEGKVQGPVTCTKCNYSFNPRIGTSHGGIIECPHCGQEETRLDAVRRKGGPLDTKLFCIEYYCEECGREYKQPNNDDIDRYNQAEIRFFKLEERLPYPRETIPDNMYDARPRNHGYKFFHQLFNSRQLLCLSLLLEGILKIKDKNTREFVLLAFSSCLETNNIFCKYETKWQKTSAMFGIPAYHPIERMAENNVWGTKYGRGTFVKSYRKMLRGKTRSGKSSKKQAKSTSETEESWFTQIANSFLTLNETGKDALIVCQNSESMPFILDNSVDLVITDPPYFDNLNYSRLADFFYVWLRIGLMEDYVFFTPETSAREKEVIMNGSVTRSVDELVVSLTKIFRECHRVLKPHRPMVFTFHHTKNWAWLGLIKAIDLSGFSVVGSHFIRSEGRTGFRKGHISYDVCIVCRKKNEVKTEDSLERAINMSKKWIKRLVKAGNGLNDSDVHSIVMGNLLTYTPNLLLNGEIKHEWIGSVLEKCIHLKNKLEIQNNH